MESGVTATIESVGGIDTEKFARPGDELVPKPGRRQLDAIQNQIHEQPPKGDLLEERPSHGASLYRNGQERRFPPKSGSGYAAYEGKWMRVADSWKEFYKMVERAYPKKGDTLFLPLTKGRG